MTRLKQLPDGSVVEMTPEEIASLPTAVSLPEPPRSSHVAWIEQALIEIGKLSAVNAAVSAGGEAKASLWRRATTIRINDPDIISIATALQIDLPALFDRADALREQPR
jgi:hypothetical protein